MLDAAAAVAAYGEISDSSGVSESRAIPRRLDSLQFGFTTYKGRFLWICQLYVFIRGITLCILAH